MKRAKIESVSKPKKAKMTPLERAISLKETAKRRLQEKVAARERELTNFKAEVATKVAAIDEILRKLKS